MVKNKTVLVTGSSRGIGRAIALRLARRGWAVALNCVNSISAMDMLVQEISEYNKQVIGIRADVSDYEQARDMFGQIESRLGGVDILINNAGVAYTGLFSEMSPLEWGRILCVNLETAINCSHLAVPHMIREKNGCIVNISSIWGITGASCEAIYSAAKGALNTFTMSLAKELGPCNIRVNAVACGVIDTDMNAGLTEDEKTALKDNIALRRFGSVEDIAELVNFLCSDGAAYITGKIITSDGGWL